MTSFKTTPFDAADYIETPEDVFLYLDAVLKDGDDEELVSALSDIARSKGMSKLAKETGLSRAGLYKALSPAGNPSFVTMRTIINALGMNLSVSRV